MKSKKNDNVTILDKYFRDIKKLKMISAEEEVELAKRIENGDEEAVTQLVKANLRFVVSIAKEYMERGVNLPDLINEGNYGMVKAAKRFDHTRGFRFISYAVWWVKQSMLQYLNEHSRTIRLPTNALSKINQLKKELDDYDLDTQNLSHEDFEFLNKYPKCGSINHIISEEGNELSDLLCDEPIKDYDDMKSEDMELKKNIAECLGILEEREKEILIYYYGLSESDESMTLETIGNKYGLTKERVRQIKGKAIKKLRANVPAILKLSN